MSAAAGSPGSWRRRLRRRDGQTVIEALFPSMLVLGLTLASALIFLLFANALMAQHAMTQSALYASSAGVWTEQQKEACEDGLPGQEQKRLCWLERQVSATRWEQVTPACSGRERVGDCLNQPVLPSEGRRFSSRSELQPLRLHIRYAQALPAICLNPGPKPVCLGGGDGYQLIERSVIIYSQSWRAD